MGKSKSKVVDLKPETISEEHLKTLQGIVSSINKIQFEIGGLEMQKQRGIEAVTEGNAELARFRTILEDWYGKNDVNIQTGELSYSSDDGSSNT